MRSQSAISSGSSLETTTSALPRAASSRSAAWTARLAPTSMPRVGSSISSTSGSRSSQRPSSAFCWLPPLSSSTRCSIDSLRIANWLRIASAAVVSRRPSIQPRPGEGRQRRQRQVGAQRLRQAQALRLAILRHQADAGRARRRAAARIGERRAVAAATAPAVGRSAPKMARSVLAPSRSDETGQAEDLAVADLEADVAQQAPARQALDAQRDRPGGARRVRDRVQHALAHHQPDHLARSRRVPASRSPTTRPSRSTVMRSAIRRISSSRWLM